MARGGINKAVVQAARQTLVANGVYPSIDAVRVELGNTGSKTTIARYLKELEGHGAAPLGTQERINSELTAMVASLVERVMEEGARAVSQAQEAFDLQRMALESQVGELLAQTVALDREVATQQAALETQTADLQTTLSSLQTSLTRNAGLSQQCADLELRINEKDAQVQSLEDKHVHARAALEHYREAVKEQREQDQRRHESQLQLIQVEQRKLQEILAVKQDDSMRLNRDNERLLAESRQHLKERGKHEGDVSALAGEIQTLKLSEARTAGVHHQLAQQMGEVQEDNTRLQHSLNDATRRATHAEALLAEWVTRAKQAEEEKTALIAAQEHDVQSETAKP